MSVDESNTVATLIMNECHQTPPHSMCQTLHLALRCSSPFRYKQQQAQVNVELTVMCQRCPLNWHLVSMAVWSKHLRIARDLWSLALPSMNTGLMTNDWQKGDNCSQDVMVISRSAQIPCAVIKSSLQLNETRPHAITYPPPNGGVSRMMCAAMAVSACLYSFYKYLSITESAR